MNEITFALPYVLIPGSAPVEDARALRILLDCLIELDLAYLSDHAALPLYRAGVVYGRTDKWYPIPALYARGFGDCKSLAAARIAELRHAGGVALPVFRWKKRPDGSMMFHILVQTPDGYEDPSKVLGMGRDENAYR
jgi:hypothetical protein